MAPDRVQEKDAYPSRREARVCGRWRHGRTDCDMIEKRERLMAVSAPFHALVMMPMGHRTRLGHGR
jgi:hypothetical protein